MQTRTSSHGGRLTLRFSAFTPLMAAIYASLFTQLYSDLTFSLFLFEVIDYNIWLVDISIFFWCTALVFYSLRARDFNLLLLALSLTCFMLLITLFRGLSGNPADVFLWVRASMLVPVAMLLGALVRKDSNLIKRIEKATILCGVILATLAISRWLTFPGFPFFETTLGANEGRPLSAPGGILLATASAIAVNRAINIRVNFRAFSLCFLLIAGLLLSGQGTAIIAAVIMMAFVLFFKSETYSFISIFILFVFLGALFTLIFVVGLESILPGDAIQYFDQRLANRSTRQAIWDGFLPVFEGSSMLVQLIGFPAGQRPALLLSLPNGQTNLWEASLHSQYFGVLSDTGYLGAAIFAFAIIYVLITSIFRKFVFQYNRRASNLGLVLLFGCLTFGYSYEWRDSMAIPGFLSIYLITCARTAERARTSLDLR